MKVLLFGATDMIHAGLRGAPKAVLKAADINRL